MDGLSLHYYTVPLVWEKKGQATEFDEELWYRTLNKTLMMEELINNHGAIMDEYDPDKKIAMVVDEWGTWYDVEPGTNPGFLYQQNTMRDALIAAINLNIFNRHCDRVVMANLAQTVNVLQAVILTEGDQMVLTPTYHVFDLYKAHQNAREIDCYVQTETVGEGEWQTAQITASASEKDGVITVTMANLAADKPARVVLEGAGGACVTGRILKGEMHQYNDFDSSPLAVEAFDGCRMEDGKIVAELPACCVAEITIK